MNVSQLASVLIIFQILFSCFPSPAGKTKPSQNFSIASNVYDVGFDPVRLARIDSLCEHAVQKNILPNVVTFVARHGQIVHYKAYGYR
ncbi:MAG: hypothetical protein GYA22_07565, partial [Bacteroidales bacterium]|nr:hypothetical protein [Bacteroidales bacterium]